MSTPSLTLFAMLAPDSDSESELAEDFRKIRERIDRVVQSEISDGEPPHGPIQTEPHIVALMAEVGEPANPQDAESREQLLNRAKRYESPYIAVPRLM